MFRPASLGGFAALRAGLGRARLQVPMCRQPCGSRAASSDVSASAGPLSTPASGDVKLYAPYIVKEIQPPRGGSPIYWSVRRGIFRAKTNFMLLSRQMRWNICLVRTSFAGVPKQSYDPKINQWVKLMDNEEWGGVGGRLWVDISNHLMFNIFLAFVLYACYFRFITNNKHNVFAKWANTEEEDDDE
ncbi:membrane protein, putative [Babesia ovata]|uniref:Membrane protein, putative n=1 Tax=Babesia ovata TaxID=189622 RepID=A0A2H6K917_9APIC|nr:uncharacterized protein BOVATA_009950 [Babesia ovata]GBE59502.1 membrane protein, putative [Babesia ovata]